MLQKPGISSGSYGPLASKGFITTVKVKQRALFSDSRQLGVDLYSKRSGNQESYSQIDELDAIIANLSLSDLNRVLYRADPEEQDEGNGGGVYVLSDTGPLVYCGLQGQSSKKFLYHGSC